MSLVVITGASRGLGEAIALAFAKLPQVSLALIARDQTRLEKVKQRCEALGASVEIYCCDMAVPETITQTIDAIKQLQGDATVLINNAGVFTQQPLLETSIDSAAAMMQVNCLSALQFSQALLPAMSQHQCGDIFFVASVASIKTFNNCGAYVMSKHAMLGCARALREETKTQGIRVSCLLPGAILTDSWQGTELPAARFSQPSDIADLIVSMHQLNRHTVVEEIVIRPQLGDINNV